MVQPIQRVNVDVTATMLEELDQAARILNVSRQAVIKTLVAAGARSTLPGATHKATTAGVLTATVVKGAYIGA